MKRVYDTIRHTGKGAYLLLASTLLGWTGCISEYHHPGLEELSGLLVVESTITNDTTFVLLSRSVGLSEDISTAEKVHGASVSVETEDGSVFPAVYQYEKERYYMLTGELRTTTRYRMRIELEGKTYLSGFLEPLITPTIESITYSKKGPGNPIHLEVTTQNEESASRYYMWSYEEIWEYPASIKATAMQIPATGEPVEIIPYNPYSPYYYCWEYGRSNSLLIGSASRLSSNRIEKLPLAKFAPTDLRLSILYYIDLRQISLRKEAYDYFNNLKKNVENTGGIFGPVPSEMKGNIICVTDESIPVIGYVEVATTRRKRQWISLVDFFEKGASLCPIYEDMEKAEEAGLSREDLTIFTPEGGPLTLPNCVDCRTRSANGRHDNKPPFWPNDHQ